MYEFSEKKRNLVNRLFVLCIVYVSAALLNSIGWHNIMQLFFPKNIDAYFFAYGAAETATNVIISIVVILIYFFLKKLRETDKTKKLYAVLFWIVAGKTIYSYLTSVAALVINEFYPDFIVVMLDHSQMLFTIGNIVYYIVLFLPLPFYIAILVKEKLDMNWMVVGNLTAMYFILLTLLIHKIRTYLHDGIHYMTDMWFNKKHPFLAVLADNRVLSEIRSYFWIAGLIVLIIIYKKKFAEQRQKE